MAISDFHSSFLKLEERGPALIATVIRPQLSEEENIDVLGKDLLDLVEQYGCRQLIVDLQHVTYVTSAALGKLITLHRRMHRKEGRLIVCGAVDSVKDVIQTARLDDYFTIAEDVPAAMLMMAAA